MAEDSRTAPLPHTPNTYLPIHSKVFIEVERGKPLATGFIVGYCLISSEENLALRDVALVELTKPYREYTNSGHFFIRVLVCDPSTITKFGGKGGYIRD